MLFIATYLRIYSVCTTQLQLLLHSLFTFTGPLFSLINFHCVHFATTSYVYIIMKLFECQNHQNKKHFNAAVNKQYMVSQKFLHTFPMVSNTCIDKSCTAATTILRISYEQSDLYMLVTTKAIHTCSSFKGSGEREQTILKL